MTPIAEALAAYGSLSIGWQLGKLTRRIPWRRIPWPRLRVTPMTGALSAVFTSGFLLSATICSASERRWIFTSINLALLLVLLPLARISLRNAQERAS